MPDGGFGRIVIIVCKCIVVKVNCAEFKPPGVGKLLTGFGCYHFFCVRSFCRFAQLQFLLLYC